jgi:hypothetical protein
MRLINIFIILFLLVSFGLGVSYYNSGLTPETIVNVIDNTNVTQIELTRVLTRVNTTSTNWFDINSVYTILESYIRFVLTLSMEVLKTGIRFGFENPEYYEASFILQIVKWIVILIIVSLLIKPLSYLIVLLILFGIWIKNKIKQRKKI